MMKDDISSSYMMKDDVYIYDIRKMISNDIFVKGDL